MNGYRESGSRPCAILGGGWYVFCAVWEPSDVIGVTAHGSIRAQTDSGIVEILVVGGKNVVYENHQSFVSVFDLAAHSPLEPLDGSRPLITLFVWYSIWMGGPFALYAYKITVGVVVAWAWYPGRVSPRHNRRWSVVS